MSNSLRLTGAIAVLSVTSACTSLLTIPDAKLDSADEALTGVPYSLPMLQYDLEITRSLSQCTDPVTKSDDLEFSMTIATKQNYTAGETYRIDYRRLAGWTKISSFKIERQKDSNILKSINASADDRTAEIATNVVKTGLGIASLVGGIPLPAAAPDGKKLVPQSMLVCGAGTQSLLDALTVASADVKEKTRKLKAVTAAVDALSSRVSDLSDADRTLLTKKVAEQSAAAKALASSQDAFDERKDAVSYTVHTIWPRRMDDTVGQIEPSGSGFERLVALVGTSSAAGNAKATENQCDSKEVSRCLIKKLTAAVVLVPDADQDLSSEDADTKGSSAVKLAKEGLEGILIRPPVYGRILVCGASDTTCAEGDEKLVYRGESVAIPQLGTLRFLPFRNEVFQNNSLVLSLTPTGDLDLLEYKNSKAQGEGLSSAALAGVNEARAYADDRVRRDATKAKDAHDALVKERAKELDAIQFELDMYTKQKELADATQAPLPTTTLQAQAAEVNARVALLQAQLAERQALSALQQ